MANVELERKKPSLENVWERNQIFTSCLLQPAAHDMLKLANFGKVEFLRHT